MTLAARAAQMCFYILNREVYTIDSPERIQNLILINLQEVLAREREACARVADRIAGNADDFTAEGRRGAGQVGAAIRGRSQDV